MTGQVVAAGAAHAAAMASIHRECFGSEAWDSRSFQTLLSSPLVFGYIAAHGGMVLARAVADEAEILTIGVVPSMRRRGMGRELVALVAGEGLRRGGASLFLEVATDNVPARRLYCAAGFAEVGTRRDYYASGVHAVLLKRALCE